MSRIPVKAAGVWISLLPNSSTLLGTDVVVSYSQRRFRYLGYEEHDAGALPADSQPFEAIVDETRSTFLAEACEEDSDNSRSTLQVLGHDFRLFQVKDQMHIENALGTARKNMNTIRQTLTIGGTIDGAPGEPGLVEEPRLQTGRLTASNRADDGGAALCRITAERTGRLGIN